MARGDLEREYGRFFAVSGLYSLAPELGRNYKEAVENLIRSGKFWKGEELRAAKDFIFRHGEPGLLEVIGGRECFPPGFNLEFVKSLMLLPPFLRLHIRSRVGQLGLELVPAWEKTQVINQGEQVKMNFHVFALGERPIGIREGERVTCFYSELGAKPLVGHELYQAINQGIIEIRGKLGKDWEFVGDSCYLDFKKSLEQERAFAEAFAERYNSLRRINYLIAGVKFPALRLNPQGFYVGEGEEPVYAFGNEIVDYRRFFKEEGVLKPIPEGMKPSFFVGETAAEIHLKEGFNAILSDFPHSTRRITPRESLGFQIKSQHIEGGRTNWPIRTEICLQPVYQDVIRPEDLFALLHIYKDVAGSNS